MVENTESGPGGSSRKLRDTGAGASSAAAGREHDYRDNERLMEAVVERDNMIRAFERVAGNNGAAGVDGLTTADLPEYLARHWLRIKADLLADRYLPQAVRGVEIPKPDGGTRQLGIPTAVDRLIGQALHQVMEPLFDPGFSESSFGFRQGRSCHQAVEQARKYMSAGNRWVVDMDLEKFFDRVNHDILMARIARRISDKRVLRLIRRYLQSGIMLDGLITARVAGTPQGSPLSPLLSNILLDDLDKELERRGHLFCRYADDCNIYVQSRRSGERVLASLTRFLERKLRLKVNAAKSSVGRPWKLKFLGYSTTSERRPRLRVSPQSKKRLMDKLRRIFKCGRGRNIGRVIEELNPVLRGWVQYFKLVEVRNLFEQLDGWIRRKLRCILWRQWKRPRTRAKRLMQRGLSEERSWKSAYNGHGPWWNAGSSHMNAAYKTADFARMGLTSLLTTSLRIR